MPVQARATGVVVSLLMAFVPACGAPPPPPAVPKEEPPPPPPPPKIALAIEKVMGCTFSEADGFDPECEAYKAFEEATDLLDEDENKASLDILTLIEDKDEKVRYLALDKLPSASASLFHAKKQAERLVAQAEKESSKLVAGPIGAAVAQIDLESTELFARIEKLAKESPHADLQRAIYRGILGSNGKQKPALELTLAGFASSDEKTRYVSLMGLSGGEKSFAEEVCGAYVKGLDDEANDVMGLAAQKLGYVGPCTAQIETLLAFAKKRAKTPGEKQWLIPNGLLNLCRNEAATDAHKKDATATAKAFVQGKHDDTVRANGIDAVMACDPKGLNFVRIYAKDKATSVKEAAQKHIDAAKKK